MKKSYWIVLAVVIIGLFFTPWDYYNADSQNGGFKTATIERGDMEMVISSSGTLNALNTVEVGTQVSGEVEKVFVDFNDKVKKGQIIAKIDTRNLESAMQQVRAMVLQAEINYEQAKRACDSAKKYNAENGKNVSIVEAEAVVEQVRTQMELAQRNYERSKKLIEKGGIAKVELEAREAEYESMIANHTAAKASLNRTKANITLVDIQKSEDDLKIAETNLLVAKADLNSAKTNLNYAIIRAPIDGMVISRNVEAGQTVAASFTTPVLFVIANDLKKMEIEANVDEADIGAVKLGQPVSFTVDAFVDEKFAGEVKQIRLQPHVIANVVTYTVIISTENEALKLMPGMTANIEITTEKHNDVLKAPVAAIGFLPSEKHLEAWKGFLANAVHSATVSQDNGRPGIIWKVEDNKPVPVRVKTGLNGMNFTELVSDNFSEGDEVIVGLIQKERK